MDIFNISSSILLAYLPFIANLGPSDLRGPHSLFDGDSVQIHQNLPESFYLKQILSLKKVQRIFIILVSEETLSVDQFLLFLSEVANAIFPLKNLAHGILIFEAHSKIHQSFFNCTLRYCYPIHHVEHVSGDVIRCYAVSSNAQTDGQTFRFVKRFQVESSGRLIKNDNYVREIDHPEGID